MLARIAGNSQAAAGMIYGIGTDICDVRRIRASFERRGMRFVERVLSDAEIAVWQQRRERWPERGVRYLATRFSAKEAFSKAIGLGLHEPMRWRRCAILNQPGGAPRVVLEGALADWFHRRRLVAYVSISDESDYATSFCIVERLPLVATDAAGRAASMIRHDFP